MASTTSRILQRAGNHGLNLSSPLVDRLTAFYDLLYRWNRTINLTALRDSDEAIDRLILEPVAAAKFLPPGGRLIDLGSGGGSPAIPLALALGPTEFVLVESRARKAAFLREALRVLAVVGDVRQCRFEEVVNPLAGRFTLVSVRALKLGSSELMTLKGLLAIGGKLALFTSDTWESFDLASELVLEQTHPLPLRSKLQVLRAR